MRPPFIHNPRSQEVFIDLLTDSGMSALSDKQWAGMLVTPQAYAGARSGARSTLLLVAQLPSVPLAARSCCVPGVRARADVRLSADTFEFERARRLEQLLHPGGRGARPHGLQAHPA